MTEPETLVAVLDRLHGLTDAYDSPDDGDAVHTALPALVDAVERVCALPLPDLPTSDDGQLTYADGIHLGLMRARFAIAEALAPLTASQVTPAG